MKDIAAGFAYSDLLTAKGLTFTAAAKYRVQVRSAPGASSTLYATLKSVTGAQPGITFVNDTTLRLTMSAEQTAPMVKSVSLDIVREDTNPDEYLGGQQTIKVVVPTTAPEAEIGTGTNPLITSPSPSGSYPERQAVGGVLEADRTVTWAKSGVDAYAVTLNPATGAWTLEETDFATKKSYAFTFTATDLGGRTAQQTVAIAITDVVETVPAPVFSFAATMPGAEGTAKTYTLNVDRDGLTGAITGTYDVAGTGFAPANAADFGGTFPSGSWTIAAGANSTTIVITSSQDADFEGDETYVLTARRGGAEVATVVGTVGNDDVAPLPGTLVPTPAGFPAMPAFTPSFSRTGSAGAYEYHDDFLWSATRNALSPTQTIWVDNETGDNANLGSQSSPLRSVTSALDAASALLPALVCVKVKGNASGIPRRYLNSAGDAPSKTYSNMNVIIEPWADGELFDLLIDTANPTWTVTSDPNIWYATGGHEYVIDYTNMDGRRTARRVARHIAAAPSGEAAAIAAVNSLFAETANKSDPTGSNYSLGALAYDSAANRTYLRLWNNRNPNGTSNIVSTRTSLIGLQFNYTTAGRAFYISGMGHAGGTNGLQLNMSGVRPTGIFDRCRFIAGLGRGALTVVGGSNTADGGDFLLHECVAAGAQSDGYNWQAQMRAIELDCWGNWNGWNTATSNNGSTLHWGCKIIRKGGFYGHNQDRSIHDVGDIASWNMGVVSGTRRGVDGTGLSIAFACGHQTEIGVSKMWLDGCRVFGTPEYRTAIFTDDTLYYANLTFTPAAGPGNGAAIVYNADTGAPLTPPVFTSQPTVTPASGTAGATTFTATPGTVSNGGTRTRAWMMGSTTLSTGLTAAPSSSQTGDLTYQEFDNGPGGTTPSVIRTMTVNAPAGGGGVFTDEFAYPNGTDLATVNGWTVANGGFAIQDGSAYGNANPSTAVAPFVPATTSYEVEGNFRLLTADTAPNTFLILNKQGTADTFFYAGYIGGGRWRISQRINGVNSTNNRPEFVFTATPGQVYNLRCRMVISGGTASLELFVDGVSRVTFTSTEAVLIPKGSVGLWQNGAPATATAFGRFDRFVARDLQAA